MKKNVQLITVSAVTLALTAVLGLLPFVFLVPLLFTCVTRDWKMTVIASLGFGIISYLYSFMGASIISIAFIENPWIPIVPRLIVGLAAHGTYKLFKRFNPFKGKMSEVFPIMAAAIVGSILNTGLVVSCLLLFASNITFGDLTMPLYVATMLINGAIELIAVCVIVPPLAITVSKALRLNSAAKQRETNNKQSKLNEEHVL